MSFIRNPQVVRCDGTGCACEAHLPIALRSQLGRPEVGAPAAPRPAITGWLFVTAQGLPARHYCPLCTPLYLKGMMLPDLPDGLPDNPHRDASQTTQAEPQPQREDSTYAG